MGFGFLDARLKPRFFVATVYPAVEPWSRAANPLCGRGEFEEAFVFALNYLLGELEEERLVMRDWQRQE